MDTVRAFEGKAARLESSMAGLEAALRLPKTSLRFWLGHMARMREPRAMERHSELTASYLRGVAEMFQACEDLDCTTLREQVLGKAIALAHFVVTVTDKNLHKVRDTLLHRPYHRRLTRMAEVWEDLLTELYIASDAGASRKWRELSGEHLDAEDAQDIKDALAGAVMAGRGEVVDWNDVARH